MKFSLAEACARAAHVMNNVYCATLGDPPSPAWEDLSDAQRNGVLLGAQHVLNGEGAEASHERWMRSRIEEGWVYGAEKSFSAKTSPNLVPYSELPPSQRYKDTLFRDSVLAMAKAYEVK